MLVVDDDAPVARALRAVLEALGFDATIADDARHALVLLATRAWDVLVTDLRMPDILGTELAREARRLSPATWIVLCSGELSPSDDAAALGVDVALAKPVMPEELQAALERRR